MQSGVVDDASNIFPCDEDYANETCQLAIYLQLRWSAESATGKPLVDGSGGFTEVAPDLYYAYYKHNPEVVSDGPDKVYFVLDSSQQKMLVFMTYLGSQTALQSEFDEAVVQLNYFHQVSYLLNKSAFQS